MGGLDEIDALCGWDVDLSLLPEVRNRLRQRPEYPSAVRRLAVNMLHDAESDPALGGLLKDAGRTVAALCAVYLNASGGVTLARLKSFIAGFGLVSPGRARALLIYMLYLGYVEPDPESRNVQLKVYRLTPRFLASYTRHEASLLDAVQILEPGAGLLLRNLGEPGVLDTFVTKQGDAFAAGSRQARPFDRWYHVFMHRHAGIQIIHALVAEASSFPPAAAIPFSIAATARRFDVSRMHVTRMMEAAQRDDFVHLSPGVLRFTEAGRQAVDWLYASRLCIHLACAARTLKAHPELRMRAAA